MKVFISWSGVRSKLLAAALRSELPTALPGVLPFFSEVDITAGDRSIQKLTEELSGSSIAILVLTRENLRSPWLLFEAGAIAKELTGNLVCPYLIDIEPADVPLPLGQFQAKRANRDGTFELITTLNSHLTSPHAEKQVRSWFNLFWGELDKCLSNLPPADASPTEVPRSTTEDKLNEILSRIRSLAGPAQFSTVGYPDPFQGHIADSQLFDQTLPRHLLRVASPGVGKVSPGTIIGISHADLLRRGHRYIAELLGLNTSGFNVTWFIRPAESSRPLGQEELALYVHSRERYMLDAYLGGLEQLAPDRPLF